VNNLVPQLAASYLGAGLLSLFFILIIGAMASTADSDLSALSSIVMTDIYGRNIARPGKANPRLMLLLGRLTMIASTGLAVYIASNRLNILELLVLVGAIWGALVFPVIASFYWPKVSNTAFSVAVLGALVSFCAGRFGFVALTGDTALLTDVLSVIGVGVIAGLMAFGFWGARVGILTGVAAATMTAPFGIGFLHTYPVLTASLLAYAVSAVLCVGISLLRPDNFDFGRLAGATGRFDITTN